MSTRNRKRKSDQAVANLFAAEASSSVAPLITDGDDAGFSEKYSIAMHPVPKRINGQEFQACIGGGQHSLVFSCIRRSDQVKLAIKVELWEGSDHMRLLEQESFMIGAIKAQRKMLLQQPNGFKGDIRFTRAINWGHFFKDIHHPDDGNFIIDALVMPIYQLSLGEWMSRIKARGLGAPVSSLFTLLPSSTASFPPSITWCRVARELVYSLRDLHDAGLLHRDIQPGNFMWLHQFALDESASTDPRVHNNDGPNKRVRASQAGATVVNEPQSHFSTREELESVVQQSELVIMDYGCGETFSSVDFLRKALPGAAKTKKGAKKSESLLLNGTCDYASVEAQFGNKQTFRDDLEGIGYILWELHSGGLPWQQLNNERQVLVSKQESEAKGLLPLCLVRFFRTVRALAFEQKPDYEALVNELFSHCPDQLQIPPALSFASNCLFHVPEAAVAAAPDLDGSIAFQENQMPPGKTALAAGMVPGIDATSTESLVAHGITTIGKLIAGYYLAERKEQKFREWLQDKGVATNLATICARNINEKLIRA